MATITYSDHAVSVDYVHSQKFDREFSEKRSSGEYPEQDSLIMTESEEETLVRRGVISEFSRSSQKRMMLGADAWQPRTRLIIGTLTYHRAPDGRTAKKHFERYRKALIMKFPHMCGLWKFEYQKRGAPHYHFILEGLTFQEDLEQFREWSQKTWSAIVGHKCRCQADWALDGDKAKFYLAKEVGKSLQTNGYEHYGRFWGWIQPKRIISVRVRLYCRAAIAYDFLNDLRRVIVDMMIEQGRAFEKDGQLFHVGSGAPLDMNKVQGWALLADGFKHVLSTLGRLGYTIDDFEVEEVRTGPPE